jgi:UDP-N-acetylmuramoyl-L-alanyl-D-glutamate--2,6-diaminopimelate ligase
MDCVAWPGRPVVAVDYAHTPDALEQALLALRPLASGRGGQVWCVFGCGGDRDVVKRPLMGRLAQQHADHVVLTSDNPRSEDPMSIIRAIQAGLEGHERVEVEQDRGRAIAHALTQARPQDVVLIAGKGHEDYQEAAGVRQPFSDKECALDVLRHIGASNAGSAGGKA